VNEAEAELSHRFLRDSFTRRSEA